MKQLCSVENTAWWQIIVIVRIEQNVKELWTAKTEYCWVDFIHFYFSSLFIRTRVVVFVLLSLIVYPKSVLSGSKT